MAKWAIQFLKDINRYIFYCDNCNENSPINYGVTIEGESDIYPFCPWCGCRMENYSNEIEAELWEKNKKLREQEREIIYQDENYTAIVVADGLMKGLKQ